MWWHQSPCRPVESLHQLVPHRFARIKSCNHWFVAFAALTLRTTNVGSSLTPLLNSLAGSLVPVIRVVTVTVTVPTKNFTGVLVLILVPTFRRRSYIRASLTLKAGTLRRILGAQLLQQWQNKPMPGQAVFFHSSDTSTPYGDFQQSLKDSINIVPISPYFIGESIDASCAERSPHFTTYALVGRYTSSEPTLFAQSLY